MSRHATESRTTVAMMAVAVIFVVALGGCFPDPPECGHSLLCPMSTDPCIKNVCVDAKCVEESVELEECVEPDSGGGDADIEVVNADATETSVGADVASDSDATRETVAADEVGGIDSDSADVCPDGCAHLDGDCVRGACVDGACAAEPVSGPCDDNIQCTENDHCDSGVCVGVYDSEICACESDADCDDRNACTGKETCGSDKQCKPGNSVVCGASEDSCKKSVCVTATGDCSFENLSGNACDDELGCTIDDACVNGVCQGARVECIPQLPCATAICDEPAGSCVYGIGSCGCLDNADCDDGNDCDGKEICDASGKCQEGPPIVCAASTVECKANICRAGSCVLEPLDDTECNDGSGCTETDRCNNGACVGIDVACVDVVSCGEGTCSEPNGVCSFDRSNCECATDGDCDDNDACTGRETCSPAGTCQAGTNVVCSPSAVPCKKSACTPATGSCSLVNDDLATCDDGQFCTENDKCSSGFCTGVTRGCNDGIGCTTDSCSEAADQCSHIAVNCCAVDADCNDNLVCNGVETCDTGTLACRSGVPPANGFPCNDGLACTGPDSCQGQACIGATLSCNDGLSCSVDSCSEGTGGCVNDTSACECVNNTDCDDGLSCTTDVCNASGVCSHSIAAGSCYIDGVCYANGITAPRAPTCAVCRTATSQTAWSTVGGTNQWPLAMGYWGNTSISPSVEFSALCHPTAISCHNCYVEAASASSSVNQTASRITDALTRGADVIEFDVVDVVGVPRVSHDDTGLSTRAALEDVLSSEAWGSYRPILFLEIKEQQSTAAFINEVIEAVVSAGFADSGRVVVLRAFSGLDSALSLARTALMSHPNRAAFRLHLLFDTNQGASVNQMKALVDGAVANGFNGVELNYRHRAILTKLQYARSRGLATGIWTVPAFLGEMLLGALVDDVDVVTTELSLDVAKAVVNTNKSLVHLDVSALGTGVAQVPYFQAGPATVNVALGGGTPTLVADPQYGGRTALKFVSSSSQSLSLYDADNAASDGYMVAFYGQINIDGIIPNDGDVKVLMGKADSGGVSLELSNPAGAVPNLLRFVINVGGTYYYADLASTSVPSDTPVLIIGAYDGSGGVRMTVDGSDANVVVPTANGGVLTNNSPIVIGADPQGVVTRRFFLEGTVQVLKVVSWPQNF